ASADLNEIIRLMVGREIKDIYPRAPRRRGDPVLEVQGLSGTLKPRSASFTLREGEILGVAGLIGAGRTETLRVCFGLDRLEGGRVLVFQHDRTHGSPRNRLAEGIG